MSTPSKLKKIQHLVHYFQRRNGTESAEMIKQWSQEWKLIKQCCARGTQCVSRTLQTENKAALGQVTKELRAPGLKPQLPQGPGPRPVLTLPSICLVLEKEQCSSSVRQGLEGKVPKPQSQAITGEWFFHTSRPQGSPQLISPALNRYGCSVLKDSQWGWQSDTMDLIQPEAKREMSHEQRQVSKCGWVETMMKAGGNQIMAQIWPKLQNAVLGEVLEETLGKKGRDHFKCWLLCALYNTCHTIESLPKSKNHSLITSCLALLFLGAGDQTQFLTREVSVLAELLPNAGANTCKY